MSLGDTFLNLNPDSPVHLWIIASNPTADGHIVILNLTTRVQGCDETCIVHAGEHVFVKHDSVVAYQRGQLIPTSVLGLMKRMGCYRSMEPLSRELLKRVQQGALDSAFAPPKVQNLIRQSLVIDPKK